jgi:CPA1 family monovalent cation:H+ antiporter
MTAPIAFIILLMLASTVAMIARRWQLPYTVALVVCGLLLSVLRELVLPGFDIGLHLTPDLLFSVLLPVLIYEAAFNFDLRDFLANWKAIITLAAPGLLVGIFAAAGIIFGVFALLGLPLSFVGVLLIATVLSATDPVAVISLMREVGAPKRLSVLMEGESLVNDGVAVVVFGVVLVTLGLDPVHPHLTATFVLQFLSWEILGALLIGGAVGAVVSWVTMRVDDHLIEITLTTIGAFGSFLIADRTHASGVIACLVAGMLCGNFGARYGMSATTRVAVASFWEYLTFLCNSFVFLLIGLEVVPSRLLNHWLPIVLVWLALIAARALLVGGTLPLLSKLEGRLPRRTGLVITWGGLRGGIAMVLALAIPRAWPLRGLAVDIVFGTCLLTILVQGTSMHRLLRWLGLARDRREQEKLQELRGRLRALQAAIRFLDRQRESGTVDPGMYQEVHDDMLQEMKALEIVRAQTRDIEDLMRREELNELRRQLLQVRKAALRQARVDGHVSETISRRLIGEIDGILHGMGKSEEDHES